MKTAQRAVRVLGLICFSLSSYVMASDLSLYSHSVSLNTALPSNSVNDKPCSKENVIYFNTTVAHKKVIELCYWGNGTYRYKYGRMGNPEIVLYSQNVTKEDVPLGGFSFIYKQFEYSVVEDNYKPTLAVYKNEEVLTQIFLTKQLPGYTNKTLNALPEKVY